MHAGRTTKPIPREVQYLVPDRVLFMSFRETSMRWLGRTALLLLLIANAAVAQVRESIEVHLVEVPVTVVDRSGHAVRGLTRANFEVLDHGIRREISSFDAIDFAAEGMSRKISPLNPAARRSFLLLFDLSFSSPAGVTKAQDAARKFISRGLQQRDLAAVGTIDVNRGFRLVTAFTTDRTLLAAAIASPRHFVSSDPLQIAGTGNLDAGPQKGVTQERAAGPAPDDLAADIARLDRRVNDTYNRSRVERQMQLLGGMARALRRLAGRKQVIFLSEGFDPRLVQGRDARSSSESVEEDHQITMGQIWRVDSDARYGNSTSLAILQEMARAFRDSDVVLHGVDIQGVRVQNDQAGSRVNSNDALHLLSRPTGGEVFKNSNDINGDLESMLRRQEVVYVLGFTVSAANDGRFHDLSVRLAGVPGGQVFHRAGYFDDGAETALERSLTNAEIILNDIPQSGLRIASLAASFPAPGHRGLVPVVVDIRGADLLRPETPSPLSADLYVYAFDEEGIVRDRMFQHIDLDAVRLGDKLRKTGVKYYATLSLPAGRYGIKTLVRLSDDRRGYTRTDVEVFGVDDVAVLPPLFMDDPGQWVLIRGAMHDGGAPYPFHINGQPFMPSANAELIDGQPRDFALFVLNAGADEVAWETVVTDGAGRTQKPTPVLMKQLQAPSMTKMVFRYAAQGMVAGPGKMDVLVHRKGSSDERRSSVALLVKTRGETP